MKTSETRKIHLVKYYDTISVIEDGGLVDNTINLYNWEYDEYGEAYREFYKQEVELIKTYLVNISANFIRFGEDVATHSRGFNCVNGLSYFYSVIIIEDTNRIIIPHIEYKDSGIACTDFDMYSYHTKTEKGIVYNDDRLLYEVWNNLDINKILIEKK